MGPLLKGNIAKIVIYDKWRVNGELTMTPLGHAGFSTHASSKVVILVKRDPARQKLRNHQIKSQVVCLAYDSSIVDQVLSSSWFISPEKLTS